MRYRTLEFPGFCVTRHLAGGRESSYGGLKNITDFWRFWYLNIPYLRINITLTFMSSSSENSKTDVSVGFRWPYLCPSKGSLENEFEALENEDLKSRKRSTLSRKRRPQISKTKHSISKTKHPNLAVLYKHETNVNTAEIKRDNESNAVQIYSSWKCISAAAWEARWEAMFWTWSENCRGVKKATWLVVKVLKTNLTLKTCSH